MLMASLEPTDITVIRCGMELLKMEAWGMPVEAILNLILLAWIALTGAGRTWAAARYTARTGYSLVRWVRYGSVPSVPPSESGAEEVGEPKCEFSEAYREACLSLQCFRPEYDTNTHHLMCDGLLVKFSSEADTANVIKLLGCPVADQNGQYAGTELDSLMSKEERDVVYTHALDLRNRVRTRDVTEANRAAAAAMRKVRYESHIRAAHVRLTALEKKAGPGHNEPLPVHLDESDGDDECEAMCEQRSAPVVTQPRKVPVIPPKRDHKAK